MVTVTFSWVERFISYATILYQMQMIFNDQLDDRIHKYCELKQ